jgi:hypothetical protein
MPEIRTEHKSIKDISISKNYGIRTPHINSAKLNGLKESTREKAISKYFKIKKEKSEIRRQIAKETIDGIRLLSKV